MLPFRQVKQELSLNSTSFPGRTLMFPQLPNHFLNSDGKICWGTTLLFIISCYGDQHEVTTFITAKSDN